MERRSVLSHVILSDRREPKDLRRYENRKRKDPSMRFAYSG